MYCEAPSCDKRKKKEEREVEKWIHVDLYYIIIIIIIVLLLFGRESTIVRKSSGKNKPVSARVPHPMKKKKSM